MNEPALIKPIRDLARSLKLASKVSEPVTARSKASEEPIKNKKGN
jgi:hypothetical protein